MLEQMMKGVLERQFMEKYPHIRLPAILRAQITKVSETSAEYTSQFKLRRKDGGIDDEYIRTGKVREYSLKILRKDGSADETFPEIPGVRSEVQAGTGAVVAIALCYGELDPFILGEVR